MNFLRRVWHGQTNGLTTAAFIVGAASLLSRLIGLFRDRFLASTFGAGPQLDAYYAAFRLPDFFYNLIILGALSAGFIPVFTEYLETKGEEQAKKLAEDVLSLVGVLMSGLAILLFILAPLLVPLMTPGFDAEKLTWTIHLTRIMVFSPLLLGLSAVMGGVLQSRKQFLPFALAPIFYNIGIIFGTLVLARWWGIRGVAWGVVIGAFFHLLAQGSVVMKFGIRQFRRPSLASSGVRRIMKLMGPRTLGLGISQLNLVILLALASSLEIGSIAVFHLANNLQSFPVGLIGISFSIAAFPALSQAASRKDDQTFNRSLHQTLRKIFFFILPATALFLLLRAQIVRLILGQGQFDWDDTIRTASVLGWFSLSLFAQALIPLLARAFYARQNTWTPVVIGVVAEIVNIVLAIVLRKPYGVAGLAMAFSAGAFVQLILLWIWLRRATRERQTLETISTSVIKTIIASLGLLIVAYLLRQLVGTIYPLRTFWQVALQTVAATAGGGLAFLALAWVLRSEELKEMSSALLRRIRKS